MTGKLNKRANDLYHYLLGQELTRFEKVCLDDIMEKGYATGSDYGFLLRHARKYQSMTKDSNG